MVKVPVKPSSSKPRACIAATGEEKRAAKWWIVEASVV